MEYERVYVYRSCDILDNDGQTPAHYTRYEEDDLHKPIITSVTQIGHYQLEYHDALMAYYQHVTPRKGHEFDEMELPMDPTEFSGIVKGERFPKFLVLVPKRSDDDEASHSIYGWIDSYEPVATKGPSVNTRIRWHIDYWLTINTIMAYEARNPTKYETGIAFGQGRVRRGGSGTKRPDPSTPRRWVHDRIEKLTDLFEGNSNQWVSVIYNVGGVNHMAYFMPGEHVGPTPGGGLAPSLQMITDGQLLTLLGTSSTATHAIWLSPFQPSAMGSPQQLPNSTYWVYDSVYVDGSTDRAAVLSETYVCDDINQVNVTDMLGNIIATLPWGSKFNYVSLRMDMGINAAKAILTFYYDDGTDPFIRWRYWWQVEGYTVTIPCIALPIFASAISDYVYSGQREYDIVSAKNQREQALKNGIANIGGSVVGGAVAGSMTAPGVGTIVGAAAGATSGIVGTTFGYGLSVKYDAKNQEAVDKLMANQGATVVQSGGGFFWMHTNAPTSLVRLVRDSVSAAELTIEQTELGYITDYYLNDCEALIEAGGPLRIEGLQLKGAVTKEAKQYIAALFERGVHLDLIP